MSEIVQWIPPKRRVVVAGLLLVSALLCAATALAGPLVLLAAR